jgi:hypothetical protein
MKISRPCFEMRQDSGLLLSLQLLGQSGVKVLLESSNCQYLPMVYAGKRFLSASLIGATIVVMHAQIAQVLDIAPRSKKGFDFIHHERLN